MFTLNGRFLITVFGRLRGISEAAMGVSGMSGLSRKVEEADSRDLRFLTQDSLTYDNISTILDIWIQNLPSQP